MFQRYAILTTPTDDFCEGFAKTEQYRAAEQAKGPRSWPCDELLSCLISDYSRTIASEMKKGLLNASSKCFVMFLRMVAGGLQCTEPASLILPFRFELVQVAA
jgi:hypothetical protein